MLGLWDVIAWVVSGGGAPAIVYYLMDNVKYLVGLPSRLKRYASWLLTAVIACFFYWVTIMAGKQAAPGIWPQEWLLWAETFFKVAVAAITFGQGIHAERDLTAAGKLRAAAKKAALGLS